jgi:hypothetical protein
MKNRVVEVIETLAAAILIIAAFWWLMYQPTVTENFDPISTEISESY